MPHIPSNIDLLAILILFVAVGGSSAAWGVGRFQGEESWFGAGVAVVGIVLVAYGILAAMFGWPPVGWMRE